MSAAGDPDHFLARNNLDALADHTVTFAGGPLSTKRGFVGIKLVPALPRGVFDAAFLKEVDDGLRIRVLSRGQVEPVLEEEADGLQGITLGMADQPDRSALDPAGGVNSRHGLAVGVQDATAVVWYDAPAGVVLKFLQRGNRGSRWRGRRIGPGIQ